MIFVCWLRIVGPLPPVLISRYAKNHSPDDFCLRLWQLATGYWILATYSLLIANC